MMSLFMGRLYIPALLNSEVTMRLALANIKWGTSEQKL